MKMKMYGHNAGHMAKVAAMAIYGKTFFQGTTCTELNLMKLCLKHQIPMLFYILLKLLPRLDLVLFYCKIKLCKLNVN